MKKIKYLLTSASNKLMMKRAGVSTTEKGDHLLQVLGTIIIAVVILILFKDAIVNIFNDALGRTTNSVTDLFNNATDTP